MLDELRDLYQEVILDHGKNPRNFRHPEDANRTAHGFNPMCGDTLFVYLKVDEKGVIQDCSFMGKGCAISTASASLMTEILKGKKEDEARTLFERFHQLCTEDPSAEESEDDDMERLEVLSGVREFPVRVKCATLAWHTMSAALDGQEEVTTE
ncbi:Fe-S cluster assembly sulfur transfer protein SufU [Fodinicurvata fenggangensis]|uniref:Fe-S cluster assembly sulfur transfer protein SufU n=1 Tax=Fodinicurvata fenggangensis TaxID=1121830 RepID=UPI00047DFA8D|nr:SUF system NifU family Fe-S cluster assembly protein [Fodinicurvata fenggangensis]